ncbi:hypothetical protein BDA99DRAFT_510148 [Phascolomyces articulosus]|uniref:Secreted protein n=1 Tax=Phascolomyces articulosus TaxID=60185 RepID=A0AAD5K0P2_9FUNG|nr:hypothetical protein BDA99DRAFT_510148 [Phascolomyces articulosus]
MYFFFFLYLLFHHLLTFLPSCLSLPPFYYDSPLPQLYTSWGGNNLTHFRFFFNHAKDFLSPFKKLYKFCVLQKFVACLNFWI